MALRTPGPRLAALAAGCVLVPSGLAAGAMLAPGLEGAPEPRREAPAQAFEVPAPIPRPVEPGGAAWAPVLRTVVARTRPDGAGPRAAAVPRHTPERTTNVVRLLRTTVDDRGRLWQEVALSALAGAGFRGMPSAGATWCAGEWWSTPRACG
jgi:hypothetical protein